MRREQKPLAGVRPGSKPAHTSTLIGYTTQRDVIPVLVEHKLTPSQPPIDPDARARPGFMGSDPQRFLLGETHLGYGTGRQWLLWEKRHAS